MMYLNYVNLCFSIVANGLSIIMILTDKQISRRRKKVLSSFLGAVILLILLRMFYARPDAPASSELQSPAALAANDTFIINDARMVMAVDSNVSFRSSPSQNATRVDILYEGEIAVYQKSTLDKDGRIWHYAVGSQSEGWLSSKWTVIH